MYDRRVNRGRTRIDEQREQIERLQTSSNELSQLAEDARRQKRQDEDRLAQVESEMEAERKSSQEEIERLKRSVADEVAKAEAAIRAQHQEKFGKLKQHCEDVKEINRLTSLANQSGGIKAYLEEINKMGVKVSMTRLQRLAGDKEKYIAELNKLDVVEILDADFEVTPPRSAEPSDRALADVAAAIDQYGTHMPLGQPVNELSSRDESGDEDEEEEEERSVRLTTKRRVGREEEEEGEEQEQGEVKDPSTGDALMPLDGNPVIPDAQP